MSAPPASTPVAIGSDHGGFELKEHLKAWLDQQGHPVVDCGTLDGSTCDYPDIAAAVAHQVASGACRFGVIVDGAGIGSSMMANKVPGVRAALCYDLSSARNSREHNDANVVTLGAGLIGRSLAAQILGIFVTTDCTEPRHLARVAKIGALAGEPAGAAAPATDDGGSYRWAALASKDDFGLAGGQAHAQNAPPAPAVQTGNAAFQASAAKWLGTDKVDSLSSADLERVAARIAELIGSGELRGNMWCFGDMCVETGAARDWIKAGVGRLSNGPGGPVAKDVAGYIDHTLLKPNASRSQIEALCTEAREHKFASVCVNPCWVKLCAELLRGSPVAVCTVVGFPLGANLPEIKAMEARRAIREGAKEIDMVINVGALKSGDDDLVFRDIRLVVDACEDGRALCKVIIETALLEDEEKVRACLAARRARADFVKTSTGFASGGATAADVALMSQVVREARMGVKASGGVSNLSDLDKMVRAGATRIGASAGVKIVKEATSG
ncbi:MAG: deoxyribose-phosphate aldolase [Deltaproteobacteria bacterium]|nr:deoxyribose-phosphate aldolase [Deltaproteobacteria bacterium]